MGAVLRIIRSTKTANEIKRLYGHQCQVCGTVIRTRMGVYAEGAHIRPLGKPHDGDDNPDNLICLCPNHHVMFDKGCFAINDDLSLVGDVQGKLLLLPKHQLNVANLGYHRKSHGYD